MTNRQKRHIIRMLRENPNLTAAQIAHELSLTEEVVVAIINDHQNSSHEFQPTKVRRG